MRGKNRKGGIVVDRGGLLTTVQDRGRFGYQQYGMPTAGALDDFAYSVGNLLVGNPQETASLEITLQGPTLVFRQTVLISVTGAPIEPRVNGEEVPQWQGIEVKEGDTLSFGALQEGCRCYLSVAGGFKLPKIMGSQSTCMRARIGGYQGRSLKQGDQLPLALAGERVKELPVYRYPSRRIPRYFSSRELRVVMGPQEDYFTRKSVRVFLNGEFTLDTTSDRMGCRLEGPLLQHRGSSDLVSDGMPLGAVQVPGHGNPMVMLKDRPTTGGYPKIATVITADIWKIAQLKPGEKVYFKKVSLKAAREARRELERSISPDTLKRLPTVTPSKRDYRIYHVTVEGKSFRVYLRETE